MPFNRIQVAPIQLVPTFPLDEARIQRQRYAAIFRSPRLLLRRVLAISASAVSSLGIAQGLTSAAVSNWQEADRELTLEIVRGLIEQSNREQDQSLRNMIRQLDSSGNVEYAIALGKFLLLKRHIESELHAAGELSKRKQEIEQLVDSVCQGICNEISRLADLKARLASVLTSNDETSLGRISERMTSGHRRMMSAYATLSETANQLKSGVGLGESAVTTVDVEESQVLDRLLEVLRDENEVSRNVDERIRNELPRVEE